MDKVIASFGEEMCCNVPTTFVHKWIFLPLLHHKNASMDEE